MAKFNDYTTNSTLLLDCHEAKTKPFMAMIEQCGTRLGIAAPDCLNCLIEKTWLMGQTNQGH